MVYVFTCFMQVSHNTCIFINKYVSVKENINKKHFAFTTPEFVHGGDRLVMHNVKTQHHQ